jgi:hypothetical protein
MLLIDESLAAHPQQNVQQGLEGVYELCKEMVE